MVRAFDLDQTLFRVFVTGGYILVNRPRLAHGPFFVTPYRTLEGAKKLVCIYMVL